MQARILNAVMKISKSRAWFSSRDRACFFCDHRSRVKKLSNGLIDENSQQINSKSAQKAKQFEWILEKNVENKNWGSSFNKDNKIRAVNTTQTQQQAMIINQQQQTMNGINWMGLSRRTKQTNKQTPPAIISLWIGRLRTSL